MLEATPHYRESVNDKETEPFFDVCSSVTIQCFFSCNDITCVSLNQTMMRDFKAREIVGDEKKEIKTHD